VAVSLSPKLKQENVPKIFHIVGDGSPSLKEVFNAMYALIDRSFSSHINDKGIVWPIRVAIC
jgi:hypothetical protein